MKRQQSLLSSTEKQPRSNHRAQSQTTEDATAQTDTREAATNAAPQPGVARRAAKLLKLAKIKGLAALRPAWRWLEQPVIQLRTAWALTILLMVAYIVVLSILSLYRYWTFQAEAFDLGNMDQVIWNTLHGRFFEFTNRGWDYYGPPTRLAIHVEPILLPLSLLYLIHSSPETLLIFQSLALGLGAIPVMKLARHWLPRWPLAGVPLVLTYCLSPALLGENLFDFHPVVLATPLLLVAVLAMVKRRYGWFVLAAGLAALCKEDIGITVAALGIYIAFWQGESRDAQPNMRESGFRKRLFSNGHRWFGLLVAATSAGWSALCFLVIIPHFLDSSQVGNNYWERYAGLGNTPGQAILHLITQPWLIFATILTLDKLRYIWGLLLTGGLLGILFAPFALIPGLPELGINVLSDKPAQYSGVYHYNAVMIAFLLVATILGTARVARHLERDRKGWAALSRAGRMRVLLKQRFPWRWMPLWCWWLALKVGSGWAWLVRRVSPRVGMSVVCFLLLVFAGYNLLAAANALSPFIPALSTGAREERINRLLAMIPPNASVSASDTLNPHLSERQDLYLFPDIGRGDDIAQYIVIDLDYLPYEDRSSAISSFDQLTSPQHGIYRIIARADGVYLAKLRDDSGG
jgi:uncharacterized membrane protein